MSESKKAEETVKAEEVKTEEVKTEEVKAADPMEEKVSFTAPIDPTGRERDIILSVNGETIRVQRGATVEIKRKFVEVWEHSNEQHMAAYRAMEAAVKGGQAPIAEM